MTEQLSFLPMLDDAKDTLRSKAKIMRKWRRRWLEIAEQFKEDSNNG